MRKIKSEICKNFYKLILESQIDYKCFENNFYNSLNNSSCDIELPNTSTIRRWFNGETEPSAIYYPFIAEALNLGEEELKCKIFPLYNKIFKVKLKYEEMLKLSNNELSQVSNFLFLNVYFKRLFATLLFLSSAILINISTINNLSLTGILLLLIIAVVIMDFIFNLKNNPDDYKAKKIANDYKLLLTKLFENSISSSALRQFITNTLFIISLPLIEFSLYRGTYFLSSIIYFIYGTKLLISSFYD